MRGKLITLEGIDGSGKSTVLKRLHHNLQDNPDVVFTREPTNGWIGEAVHRAIRSKTDPLAELFLFIADHADHLSTTIRPALEADKIVISDRYSDSRYAYQGATLEGTIDHPMQWVMRLHKGWTVVPDITILLDVHPSTAIKRVGNRNHQTKFEKMAFLQQVRSNYLKLVKKEPHRFLIVDAELPVEEVEAIVLSAICR